MIRRFDVDEAIVPPLDVGTAHAAWDPSEQVAIWKCTFSTSPRTRGRKSSCIGTFTTRSSSGMSACCPADSGSPDESGTFLVPLINLEAAVSYAVSDNIALQFAAGIQTLGPSFALGGVYHF